MTRRPVVLALAALACLFAGRALAQTAPAAAPSLIANGDFETLHDGAPAGWMSQNTDTVSAKSEDGNHFLHLQTVEAGKMVMVYRSLTLKPQDKAFELSYRVRYDGIKVGKQPWFDGRIMMNFKDAAGKVVKPSPAPPVFRGASKGWETRSQKFIVPEGAKTLEIMPCLFEASAGSLDFDDFRLTSLDDTAAAQLKAAIDAAAAKKVAQEAEGEKKVDQKITAELAATGNLVTNGNFAKANKAGNFADTWGSLVEGSGITWQSENGQRFMRLVQQEPGKLQMLHRFVLLPSSAKGIELTIRYRTADVKRGDQMPGDARAVLHWMGGPRIGHIEYGDQVKPEPPAIGFTKGADWTETTKRMLVPEGATKLQLMPGLWFTKAGTLDIAEIRITPLGDADAQAMAAEADAAARLKAQRADAIAKDLAMPAITPEAKVSGNHLVTVDGKPLWLQGLSVDSMQWGPGDNILWSIRVAIDEWHANVIRLPVHDKLWFGLGLKGFPAGNPEPYRQLVDQAVKLCAAKGAYLVLDLHQFGAPMPEHVEFWKDAAARYKNNPAVIFELFNEPHDIPWDIWRDGGDTSKAQHKDNAVVENADKNSGKITVGMQAMVDAVRGVGARNIVVTGGLAWSYDLSGILNGYALKERDGGNGIVYSHHNYPWKTGWQKALLDAAEKYPILVSEVGCPEKWEDFSFIKVNERSEKLGPGCTWPNDMLGVIQKHKLNWTGFSFHPHCGPMVIKDWDYAPTPYWGVFVKDALAGKQFTTERLR